MAIGRDGTGLDREEFNPVPGDGRRTVSRSARPAVVPMTARR